MKYRKSYRILIRGKKTKYFTCFHDTIILEFQIHIFYSNLVANATDLNFGKPPGLELTAKILNNFDPSQNNEGEKFVS